MRNHKFVVNEFYHLYSRGVEKRPIFLDSADHDRFIKLLFHCNGTESVNIRAIRKGLTFVDFLDERGENLVDIGAYCLMPNHFHLLLKQRQDLGVSKFMQKVLTAYTMYFNTRYERSGRLFSSSFKSKHANEDRYLKYLFAYIHLNPLKILNSDWRKLRLYDQERLVNSLSGYDYSSFPDYVEVKRSENLILNREGFPEYFPTSLEFIPFIREWIEADIPEV